MDGADIVNGNNIASDGTPAPFDDNGDEVIDELHGVYGNHVTSCVILSDVLSIHLFIRYRVESWPNMDEPMIDSMTRCVIILVALYQWHIDQLPQVWYHSMFVPLLLIQMNPRTWLQSS